MPASSPENTPLVLIVRDGWGENPHPEHDAFNAVRLARTPVADGLARDWPSMLVTTCGEDVGLPAGTMGNSEVGHQNIGAGRIVDQALMRISRAIRAGEFERNPTFAAAFDHVRASGGALHLMGLASDGRVHSDLPHLFALIDLAAARGLAADRLIVHAFTDGRDTGPGTAPGFIEQIERRLRARGVGRIGSVIGRFYAMDRDHRWDRVALAYDCLTGELGGAPGPGGVVIRTAPTALEAVRRHEREPADPNCRGDEFVVPTRVVAPGDEPALIGAGDAVIFFNFRGDRPRELTRAFVDDDDAWARVAQGGFARPRRIPDLLYCTLTEYERGLPVEVAFPRPPKMRGILGATIAERGLRQFRCAETEKFPHVTFFFNDYREEPFEGEHRVLVPSPRDVSTYDQKPEMSAAGVTDAVVARLADPDPDALFVVNFANADMVAHTGSLDAAVRAVECVDACVGTVIDATLSRGGSLVVTADHGNAEQMRDPATDTPHTAHTVYDVPLLVVGPAAAGRTLRPTGRLGDIAPTVLDMMGLDVPPEMTGTSLLAQGGP